MSRVLPIIFYTTIIDSFYISVLQAESVNAGTLRNNTYEFPTPGTVLPLNITNGTEVNMKIPQTPLLARANSKLYIKFV